jgi:hypothetical protein
VVPRVEPFERIAAFVGRQHGDQLGEVHGEHLGQVAQSGRAI